MKTTPKTSRDSRPYSLTNESATLADSMEIHAKPKCSQPTTQLLTLDTSFFQQSRWTFRKWPVFNSTELLVSQEILTLYYPNHYYKIHLINLVIQECLALLPPTAAISPTQNCGFEWRTRLVAITIKIFSCSDGLKDCSRWKMILKCRFTVELSTNILTSLILFSRLLDIFFRPMLPLSNYCPFRVISCKKSPLSYT